MRRGFMKKIKLRELPLLGTIGSGDIIFKSKVANRSELYITIIIVLSLLLIYFIISKIYARKKHRATHGAIPGALISFSSYSIKNGFPMKLYLRNVGYFSCSVINNDHRGIIVELPHWQGKKKMIRSNDEIICFYVENNRKYEIKTTIKNIESPNRQYILLSHKKAKVFRLENMKKINIDVNIPVLFTPIFSSGENTEKTRIMKGTIKAISIFGVEIYSAYDVKIGSTMLFEPNQTNNKNQSYNFSGKVIHIGNHSSNFILYVEFLSLDNQAKKAMYRFINMRLNVK